MAIIHGETSDPQSCLAPLWVGIAPSRSKPTRMTVSNERLSPLKESAAIQQRVK